MRPISNLTSMSEYKLDPRKQRSGFIGLYDGRVGASKNALLDVYWALVAGAVCPAFRELEIKTDSIKGIVDERLRDKDHSLTIKSVLRKNMATRRLEFRTPLVMIMDGVLTTHLTPSNVRGELHKFPELQRSVAACERFENTPLANGAIISGKTVSEHFGLSAKAREIIGESLLSIDGTLEGQLVTVWATFKIDTDEAEYLTNSSFAEMRLSDLYPTLINWTGSIFGRYSKPPKTVTKVSAIAQGVREATAVVKVAPRVGFEGLVADIKGDFYYIPEIDQSSEYEQKLLDYGLRDDGSYSWHQPRAELDDADAPGGTTMVVDLDAAPLGPKRKLPKNLPIFSDWLNDKFCFSNTTGNLAVYDLSDTVPVKNFHVANILGTKLTHVLNKDTKSGSVFGQMLSQAGSMDNSIYQEGPKLSDAPAELQGIWEEVIKAENRPANTSVQYLARALRMAETLERMKAVQGMDAEIVGDMTFADLCPGTEAVAFKHIGRLLEKVTKLIDNNVEVLYSKIQVMSALQLVAYCRLIMKFGSRYSQVKAADLQERQVYLNQGVDPSYVQEGTPFVKDGLNFQPHQAKVDNVMRGSPDFAAYDVDAGGGKTILVMTNIFNEMRKGVCKRPIVACPPPLVSQYVEEVVFVAEGRVNVIPLTNATLRMHGEERLKMMLERAPINTIVVTDFDFVKGRGRTVSYGNKSVNVFTNAEWLRQFEFDLIAVDESHKLSNLSSSRREGMARLMQDIPKKRLASGTFVNNTITDLVSQVALFDPTIFGGKEKFHEDYASNVSGDKVTSWKPGAERKIRDKIGEHVVFATARRKEWAALLPPSEEQFDGVELNDNQRLLYDSILLETTELIREAMEKDKELKDALTENDETVADDLESMLRPYLVRLERFLSAPGEDEAADKFLVNPEDRISPKVTKIHEICKQHIDAGIPGKILIFTNYLASAEAVFKYAPPELKSQMIHYMADKKMEARAQFSRNDKLRIMVGASSSMDTGLNFQHVSRLIRMETVWTPGLVEQGNSRINRPQLKKAETRDRVYFNWLVVDRSIDVTKIARLTAKIVSKAKFDEADVPEYQEIENMEVITMNLANIAAKNDFNNELRPYLEVYQQYKKVEKAEYKKYRESNAGKLEAVAVKSTGLMKGSKLMSRVPYVPGMTIYGTDQLGLVRYDEFVHQDLTELETEDTESEDGGARDKDDDADNPKAAEIRKMKARWANELELANGMPCHTEFGDGVIYGARRKVWVRLNAGGTMRIPKLQVFVITRTTTNSKDIRTELLKAAGDLPLDAPIEVPVEEGTQTLKRRKNEVLPVDEAPSNKNQIAASFSFAVINDMLAVTMDAQDNPKAAAAVQNFGFKMSPEYWFTKIRGPVLMLKLFKTLASKKFTLNRKCSAELKEVYEDMRMGGRERMSMPGFATAVQIKDFTREQIKPSSDPYEIKVYPRVDNGQLYLFMPKKGQAANGRAIKVASEGVKWLPGGGDSEFIRYVKNKPEALQLLKDIKASGIVILNEKSLAKEYQAIKMGK